MLSDPAPVGERQDEVLVQSSRLSEVDVFDARGVAKLRAAQPVGELPGVSLGDLSVDEEPESFLERQVLDLGRAELFDERLGHGRASQLVELLDGGMGEHVWSAFQW